MTPHGFVGFLRFVGFLGFVGSLTPPSAMDRQALVADLSVKEPDTEDQGLPWTPPAR
ncbi:hypothetical protein ACTWP5_02500 [Streptomyces sp. 4N509B]|uniref:hypothetical protein n=1 Tax=Streptomyces sp. 4N509B TaxID=3457413 RepID=UPI003FD44A0E